MVVDTFVNMTRQNIHDSTVDVKSNWDDPSTRLKVIKSCANHNYSHLPQGVVTYISPVEVFPTAIKFFDRQKVYLIA